MGCKFQCILLHMIYSFNGKLCGAGNENLQPCRETFKVCFSTANCVSLSCRLGHFVGADFNLPIQSC